MRRALIASGLLLMVYAVVGATTDTQVSLPGVLIFGVAVLALHDGVFLPLVLAAGALIGRVPPRWRSTVRAVAVVNTAVAVVALPLLVSRGHDGDNPTILPRPYDIGLLVIVVTTTVSAVLCRKGIERWRNGRRRRPRG
ncbi:hypothetical protein [Actinoplanes awajinensis]|nr:hypothetical protein [Actinoplanes awajinensis]